MRIRFFRPFPDRELIEAVSGLKGVGVLDRSVSFGTAGSMTNEVRAALYGKADIPVAGFIAGLGGRDVRIEDFRKMYSMIADGFSGSTYINARGGE